MAGVFVCISLFCLCSLWFVCVFLLVFFFKQKTAYEMRISDWSSDVCSSDLVLDRSTTETLPSASDEPLDTDYENVYTNGAAGEGPGSEPAFATRGAAASGDDEYSLEQRLSERVTLRQHLTEIGRASCRARVSPYV